MGDTGREVKGEVEIRASWHRGDSWEINRRAEEEGKMIFAVRKQNYSTIGDKSNHDSSDFTNQKL